MSNSDFLQTLPRLWQHITPRRRRQYGVLLVVMVLASFAEVISIGAVVPFLGALTSPERIFDHPMAQSFINVLNLTEPRQLLLPLTMVFGVGAVISGVTRLWLLRLQTRLAFATGADLGFRMYRGTLYQPYAVHAARNSSQVIAGISNKTNLVVGDIILPLSLLVSSILIVIAILLTLMAIEPVVAIAVLTGFGAIYAVVMLISRTALSEHSRSINHETSRVIKVLQEGLGGIRDVLIDGTQATYCNIFRNADLPLRRAQASVHIIKFGPRYGIEALGMLLLGILAYSLASRPSGFAGAIPVLGAMALGAQRLLPMIQTIYACWAAMLASSSVLNEVLDLLDQPLPAHVDAPPQSLLPFQHSITLSDLTFRYQQDTPWVFHHGVSLSIPKGSRIGFIGATGSGKSTLLDIIMGLLRPTSGSLAVDGVSIVEKNCRGWQGHLAHVPQAIFLSDTTIAENIAFGIPVEDIDYVRVREAAQKAQIAQTIDSWSSQYNTVVGERGVRLSGGQRQRIGIARALYKQADVIVFDEATSALDNETEHTVMEAIENLDDELTIIIVAHRLTTLKNCTQIVELDDGKIKRIGSYADIVGQAV